MPSKGDTVDKQQEAEQAALALRSSVDSLTVTDQASHDIAQAYNKQAYQGRKAFHEWFDPIDDASKKQRQAVIAQGKLVDEPFDYIIKATGAKCAAWVRAEQAKAAEEKRKAEEIARRAAEEQRIKEAEALEAAGMTAAAEAALDAPITIAKIEVSVPAKDEGVSYRDVWSAECVDIMALAQAVVSGKVSTEAIQANSAWLGQWARLTKGAEALPGVKVTNTPIQVRRI